MDNNEPSHRRNQTTQSIPLRNLDRPPEPDVDEIEDSHQHRRTLSDRRRRLFQSSPSRHRPNTNNGSYAPLDDYRPYRPSSSMQPTLPTTEEDFDDASPLVDAGGFQDAIGFSAWGSNDSDDLQPILGASALPSRNDRLGNITGANDSFTSIPDFPDDDDDHSPDLDPEEVEDRDTARLTHHTQPISMTTPHTPLGQRHDRLSTPTVRFSLVDPPTPSISRLGDDLGAAENGFGGSDGTVRTSDSRMRSLSPSSATSPFRRASTVVRNMSQRVVNLSNEPEVAEQHIRRRRSHTPQPHSSEHFPDSSYTHDGPSSSPIEKPAPQVKQVEMHDKWVMYRNPLRGKTLGVFSPDNPIRTKLCDILVHPFTEPLILVLIVLQAILVTVDASHSVFDDPRSRRQGWGHSWIDYAMLALFSIYTVETAARILVSGFIINPIEYSTINRKIGIRPALMAWARSLFTVQPTEEAGSAVETPGTPGTSITRIFTANPSNPDYQAGNRQQARIRLAHRAFLRHSFNRIDFLAVVSYWISFLMSLPGVNLENEKHFYLFHMMSSLRIMRLLSLTSGTSIILRSLKKAAPLLLNVALLIGFFWLLFAIIGVQSFKSSLRRRCVWYDPDGLQNPYISDFQFCGGSLQANGTRDPYIYQDGSRINGSSSSRHKGYLCPPNSKCVSLDNPYRGTVSFDNVVQSMELVFVLMTSNTYSDFMYYLTDSDYLFAAVFFAGGTIVMTFWLVNLLIAVITTSFQVIREQSKTSAFADQVAEDLPPEVEEEATRISHLRRLFDHTYWMWITIIACGLVVQCLRSADMSDFRRDFINISETVVTFLLLLEILIRFVVDPRRFFRNSRNWIDLAIALITAVIQVPAIHESGQPYAWLTFFQILRVYRVVLAIPFTRDLLVLVVGNLSGLLNLILFVLLLTFFGALFASQLFRGELEPVDSYGNTLDVTFATIYNSFLGMYQVLSSENWTSILFSITAASARWDTAWIGAIFVILWFTLAFCRSTVPLLRPGNNANLYYSHRVEHVYCCHPREFRRL